MIMDFDDSLEFAVELDKKDELSIYRSSFFIPKQNNGEDVIYFAGHSLGLQPKKTRDYIIQEINDWADLAVDGHFHAKHPWLQYHEYLTDHTASLVGAKPIEVVNMNTLTVNLHLMLVSFYRPTRERYKILIESPSFPSDHYAIQSHIRFHGFDVSKSLIEINPKPFDTYIKTDDILDIIKKEGKSIALILLPGVNYYSGQAFEFEKITQAGHSQGCIVGFDLAHAVGNLILNLHNWNVDFAVWCSYKYLNGGPGAIAGCFVHDKYAFNSEIPKFWGWWGHDKTTRFLMDKKFIPIPGAESWQLSNPPIFQLAAQRAALDIFNDVGMQKLREKSELQTSYMQKLLEYKSNLKNNHNYPIEIITPSNIDQRGCQLSLRVKMDGKNIHKKLINNGIICDWREPDVIRVAPVPLYNTFKDIYNFVEILYK